MPAPKYTYWISDEGQAKIKQYVKEEPTDAKVAERMGVSKALLSRWRANFVEIRRALVRLKTIDGKKVDSHDIRTGRPPRKLDNVNDLQTKIDKWMQDCKDKDIPPTRTGLCLALNISKDALYNYLHEVANPTTVYQPDPITGELRPISVQDILKRAILSIENDLEVRMIKGKGNVAGLIFDLKNNHGYADKQEVGGIAGKPIESKKYDDKELDDRIQELLRKSYGDKNFRVI